MTLVRVRGFKIFRDRHGKVRCYHRATGEKVDLAAVPLGSAGFFAACERIAALARARAAQEPKPGTLGGLVAFYFNTEHFKDTLSERTRQDYRKVADYLSPISETPVSALTTPLISGIHDKASAKLGWRQANMLRTLLVEVFKRAIPHGLVRENFATAVIPKPRPKGSKQVNRPWTVEELDLVLHLAPARITAAVALMANTGLDPSDALALRRDKIEAGVIWAHRAKTGEEVALPINGRLQRAFEKAPPHAAITVLANSKGLPWTYNGFSTVWHRWRDKQVKEGTLPSDLTLKGLRHTVATILREAGMHPREVADFLGQKNERMAQHYSRNANLAERNRKASSVLDSEIERRTKIVKPFPKPVKP